MVKLKKRFISTNQYLITARSILFLVMAKGKEIKRGRLSRPSFVSKDNPFILQKSYQHQFGFNEAFSLIVYCETQAEIDYYWEKLWFCT